MDEFKDVDAVRERIVYQNLSWCLNRVAQLEEHPREWISVQCCTTGNCERCAPTAPQVSWVKIKGKMKGVEDPGQAGRYEQALKARPKPFVTQLQHNTKDGTGVVQIGINPVSLIHRAAARLPPIPDAPPITMSYMVDTCYTPATSISTAKYDLTSNKKDVTHTQPPNFKIPLRPEQLRSLTWMVTSEDPAYNERQTFVEEEISEALSEALSWRVLGRAERRVHVSGGVLADAVGYGKTAITLGLIDCSFESQPVDTSVDVPGFIPVKATLCVVPPHLTLQWVSEIKKFTGKAYKAIGIATVASLNKLTIKDIEEADIIVIASNIFKSTVYLGNLEEFSAGGKLPPADGRHFNQRVEEIAVTRKEQVERLKNDDVDGVVKTMRDSRAAGTFHYPPAFVM